MIARPQGDDLAPLPMPSSGNFASMIHRRLLLPAATMLAMAACAPLSAAAPLTKAADFEAAISQSQQNDPQSPDTLNLHLAYANFLSGAAGPGCTQQLAQAQAELDIVTGKPAFDVMLPLAPARIADSEYKIHIARAACGSQTPVRSELQQALEAGQRATQLYRDGLDYPSAAVMQFNVAAAYQQLDDADHALAALQAAIAMDRDYGLREDAQDNTKLLLQWQNQNADDSSVAAAMKDFPVRAPEFKFAWSGSDAGVTLDVEDTSVIQGKTIRSRHTVELKHQIREGSDGWVVTNEAGKDSYELGDWPADANVPQWPVLYFLVGGMLSAPDIAVGQNGDFKSVRFPEALGAGLTAQLSAEILSRTGTLSAGTGQQIESDPSVAFAPDFIASRAAQDYGLETGTWIGAKLEQGVWYQMTAPLFLPGLGLGHFVVQHDVSFAFTRELPCEEGSDRVCAEIVIHALPDTKDLKSALKEADPGLKLADNQAPHVWSRTDMRLVIDPKTLLAYIFDTRQAWYDKLDKSDPVIESIRTVMTAIYP